MGSKRKKYSPEFKFRVVMEALRTSKPMKETGKGCSRLASSWHWWRSKLARLRRTSESADSLEMALPNGRDIRVEKVEE